LLQFSFLILLSISLLGNPAEYGLSMNVREEASLENEEKDLRVNEMSKITLEGCQHCSRRGVKKIFKNIEEAEEYLKCLLKEKEVLVGDFYGVNLTVYRYVNIFDRLGYIRFKIAEIDIKIKRAEFEISKLERKLEN
jgi:hypothetical protein